MARTLTVAVALLFGLVPWMVEAQGYSGVPSAPESTGEKQVESLQDRIQSQPEMMDAIRALQADPAVQDLLNDPSVAAALESGNTAALLANPKVTDLANKPAVQDITKKLGQ